MSPKSIIFNQSSNTKETKSPDRIPIIAANWKMNKTVEESMQLLEQMVEDLDVLEDVDKVICLPFVSLYPAIEILEETEIALGAQNMYWEDEGAFTGEISPLMLRELVDFVIIGHSERRKYFGETDEHVNLKVKAAIRNDITPIIAVGEDLTHNQSGQTQEVVTTQLRLALEGVSALDATNIVVAYEPLWAIGSGQACAPALANQVAGYLRETLVSMFGEEVAQAIRIQYGGSVNSKNIGDFMQETEIDGALVGGASLNPTEFIRIVSRTQEVYARRGR